MAWRDAFSINTDGRLGALYESASNVSVGQLITTTTPTKIKLATFNYLPVGVYSIFTGASIQVNSGCQISYALIGATQTSVSPVVLYPQNNVIPTPTSGAISTYSAPLDGNFTISVTNANPYYIFLDIAVFAGTAQFDSQCTCIATKIA